MEEHHKETYSRMTLKQRQIMATGFALKYRDELLDVERRIKEIVGNSSDDSDSWRRDQQRLHEVKDLLTRRCNLLNLMFMPSDANMARFKGLNSRLEVLCRQLRERIIKLKQSLPLLRDSDFDDDYELEGELRFCYNDEHSVLKLDDDHYCSDFCRMIDIIHTCSYDTYWECIERISPDSPILDDGVSWNEPPFCGRPEFDDIIICHAMHNLSDHMLYSIPDILRLDDFWAEAHLTCQSITKQDGVRYIHCTTVRDSVLNPACIRSNFAVKIGLWTKWNFTGRFFNPSRPYALEANNHVRFLPTVGITELSKIKCVRY